MQDMSTEPNPAEWVTIPVAMGLYGVGRSALYTRINNGQVARIRVPGSRYPVRLSVADLNRAFKARRA